MTLFKLVICLLNEERKLYILEQHKGEKSSGKERQLQMHKKHVQLGHADGCRGNK